ncbi:hypothetical protein N1496_07280 [Streptococcus didelphis]|uniref:Uncharacterized protein n=1 Tax=Streptococcus didelphis TaxID=102886 RepID=A0ABY9LG40_9STRE|nr:hypothetical protein [Streptococcus didelphis]WMB27848.1 hypothetical protein N1496_07280 [Streptococcus didelphis]
MVNSILADKDLMLSLFKESSWLKEEMEYEIYNFLTDIKYLDQPNSTKFTYSDVSKIYDTLLINNKINYYYNDLSVDMLFEFITNYGFDSELDEINKSVVQDIFTKNLDIIGKRYLEKSFGVDLKYLEFYITEKLS